MRKSPWTSKTFFQLRGAIGTKSLINYQTFQMFDNPMIIKLSKNYQTFFEDYQTFLRDYQTFILDYQTFSGDYQTFSQDYQTFSKDYQTFPQKLSNFF